MVRYQLRLDLPSLNIEERRGGDAVLETQCGGRRSLSSAPRGFCSVLDSFDDYNDVLLRLISFSRNANDYRLESGKNKVAQVE